MNLKITFVLGTRPEIIKLAPLIKLFKKDKSLKAQVIFTNQHPDLSGPIFKEFALNPDVVLDIKRNTGDINEFHSEALKELHKLAMKDERPHYVFVQGDTASGFLASLFAFHFKIPIVHIEAGLRSYKVGSPFPEEFYRQTISKMAAFHFCPTKSEKNNLIKEGIDSKKIIVTGNTIVDSIKNSFDILDIVEERSVMVSLHRRESKDIRRELIESILSVAEKRKDIHFEFISHPSSNESINEDTIFYKNTKILSPMSHKEFIQKVYSSCLLVTDSGGAQEEAAYLNIPTLIVRESTERKDGLSVHAKIVGLKPVDLKKELEKYLEKPMPLNKGLPHFDQGSPSETIYKYFKDKLLGGDNESTCGGSTS